MARSKFRLSLTFLSALTLSLACNDDQATDGGAANTETDGMETMDTMDSNDTNEGMEQEGDGDGDTGDGDGDTGDGDGDTGDGDGDTGDGDGDTGDGDGDTGDGDGDTGDGDGDTGDGDGDTGDGDGDTGDGDGDTGDGDGDTGDGDGDTGDGDGDTGDGDGDNELQPIWCGNKLYECGDTIDNDMDGLIDLDDPECISPCDDNEGSFETDLPGQNNDCKGDCYWDGNSGGGDDGCEWNLQCDPQNPGQQIGCPYDPDKPGLSCELEMPAQCLDFCVPLVPNGCDCFGCCLIGEDYVYLGGAECALNNLDACESCTFHPDCNNECEPDSCEVCFGQDPDDLPPECEEPECPDGVVPCFDESDCSEGEWCQTGCCVQIIN
ncbi:MAG: hypothetical protein R6X02_30330 [Enhygromyxa sp.]